MEAAAGAETEAATESAGEKTGVPAASTKIRARASTRKSVVGRSANSARSAIAPPARGDSTIGPSLPARGVLAALTTKTATLPRVQRQAERGLGQESLAADRRGAIARGLVSPAGHQEAIVRGVRSRLVGDRRAVTARGVRSRVDHRGVIARGVRNRPVGDRRAVTAHGQGSRAERGVIAHGAESRAGRRAAIARGPGSRKIVSIGRGRTSPRAGRARRASGPGETMPGEKGTATVLLDRAGLIAGLIARSHGRRNRRAPARSPKTLESPLTASRSLTRPNAARIAPE
jgi:hypothetical protein